MALTYEKIASTTLAANAINIEFTSIPSTYTDLRLTFTWRLGTGSSNTYPAFYYNGDNGSGSYSLIRLYGSGGSAGSQNSTSANDIQPGLAVLSSSTIPVFFTLDLFSYTNSLYKTGLYTVNQDTNGSGWSAAVSSLYRSTTPITSIGITDVFAIGFGPQTVATLYGIKAA